MIKNTGLPVSEAEPEKITNICTKVYRDKDGLHAASAVSFTFLCVTGLRRALTPLRILDEPWRFFFRNSLRRALTPLRMLDE